jgi:NADH-quinone oxidoreductase subunit L
VVLAIGAIFAGLLNVPEREHNLATFLGTSPSFHQGYEKAAANPEYKEPVAAAPMGQLATNEALKKNNPDYRAMEEHESATEWTLMFVSGFISIAGIFVAYILHLKERRKGEQLPEKFQLLARLFEAKYWVDEIYQAAIVEPLRSLGRAFFAIDRIVVDGIVWAISFIPQASGWALKLTTQRGYLQGYAATMLFGIAVILLIIFL